MKVAVVGAGPIGLYVAGLIRVVDPYSSVTVYEKRSLEEMVASGVGYTLNESCLVAFDNISKHLAKTLIDSGQQIELAHVNSGDLNRKSTMTQPLLGVSYDALIKNLAEASAQRGATIHYGQSVDCPLDQHKLGHPDIVILANGAFSPHLESPAWLRTREDTQLAYMWNVTDQKTDTLGAKTYAINGMPLIQYSYPLGVSDSKHRTAIIFEALAQHVEKLSCVQFRNLLKPVAFRMLPVARTHTFFEGNVACVGDAALTPYFCTGSGILNGMKVATLLVQCLMRKESMDDRLLEFNRGTVSFVNAQYRASQNFVAHKVRFLRNFFRYSEEEAIQQLIATESADDEVYS